MCVSVAAAIDTLSMQAAVAITPPSLLQRWAVLRAQELNQVWRFLTRAAESRSFPSDAPVSHSALWTAVCTLALGQVTVVLVTGVGRRQFVLGVQTVISSLLLLALIGVVLGLPIGDTALFCRHGSAATQSCLEPCHCAIGIESL